MIVDVLYTRTCNARMKNNKRNVMQIEVKVKENWRQNEGLLKHYGYGGQIQAL